ncbi:MAG: hypothetical protein DI582_05345 [Azospirillum brasilense]|nr:MAG: hypothetical protein DI582_05345 [Azospirillum brasilense]
MFGWLKPRPTLTLDALLQQTQHALQTRALGELGATHRFVHCLMELDGAVRSHGFAHYFTLQPAVLAWGACISGLQTIGQPEAAQLVNEAVRAHMDAPEEPAVCEPYTNAYRAQALDMHAALSRYLARHRIAGLA